jgi:hypothetical protein
LSSGRAQAADQARADRLELAEEERRASFHLVALRRAITRRPALHDVADVNVLALDADKLKHPVEQLSGASHKRESLLIFVSARAFADEHQFGVRVPLAEDDGLSSRGQTATVAVA